MAVVMIEVFTSPTCPHCPNAIKATKQLFENHPELKKDVIWKEISTASPIGYKKARSYGIQGVPTIIISNLNTNEKFGIVGAPSEKKYLETVYKIMGKEQPKDTNINQDKNKESKKSFIDKFVDIFK